ncbi:unnamed protein product [Medioppia subpectinata]|uniref:G-protein coupled receptors family 1 profile domain-containing protein n=1 Tax=Medioppia subpectinata TaxID=1979941 RepID=A0A7R9LF29_9ACAR|nr:unnamed protein product [Medioppia subpectinata]CAG2118300.1 unnamed protein product [Medioppia subpectinata]
MGGTKNTIKNNKCSGLGSGGKCAVDASAMDSHNIMLSVEDLFFVQLLSSILLFIIILITIIGNIFVITAVITTPKLQIRSNYLILSLSITDLLTGVLSMPVFAYHEVVHLSEWRMGYAMCHIYIFLTHVLTTVSFLHIFFIAIDRYLSVSRVEYSRHPSLRPARVMIAISWTLPLAMGVGLTVNHIGADLLYVESIGAHICLFVDDPDRLTLASLSIGLILLVVIYSLYYGIYKKSCEFRHKTQTKGNKRSKASTQRQTSTNRALSCEFQVAVRSIIITLAFTICMLPYIIMSFTININQELKYQMLAVMHLIIWFVYINSMLNPIIYGSFNGDFRLAFKRLLEKT